MWQWRAGALRVTIMYAYKRSQIAKRSKSPNSSYSNEQLKTAQDEWEHQTPLNRTLSRQQMYIEHTHKRTLTFSSFINVNIYPHHNDWHQQTILSFIMQDDEVMVITKIEKKYTGTKNMLMKKVQPERIANAIVRRASFSFSWNRSLNIWEAKSNTVHDCFANGFQPG